MKILLLGEYSNLHWTLSEGLRSLGHRVTVASDGCGWMDNRRDVDLCLKSGSVKDRLKYRLDLFYNFAAFRGYDVVQVISPVFLKLSPRHSLRAFNYLKANNGKVFLGAFGTDYYYTKACLDRAYRYSDFYIPAKDGSITSVEDNLLWTLSPLKDLNIAMAEKCDGIVSCLYEYYRAYEPEYSGKLAYIPLPVNTDAITPVAVYDGKARFFIGVQRAKMRLKGSDILLAALKEVKAAYHGCTSLYIAESLPYAGYIDAMQGCNVLVDQLYSYTPGMNALLGMAKGMVLAGGGEGEMYDVLGEKENRPIINLLPDRDDVVKKLSQIVENRDGLCSLGAESRRFVEKHHNYISVAEKYIKFWSK